MDKEKTEKSKLKQYVLDWKIAQYSPFKFDHKKGKIASKYFEEKGITDVESLYQILGTN